MNKRLVNALFRTMIFFAGTHLLILTYLAITTGNLTYVNLFAILDLQEFFPGIEVGIVSGFISSLVGIIVFFIYFGRPKKK
mgnify:CR=1 FL=1